MNKNYKNRVRKVDIERQQEELKKAQEMQGQGDKVIKGDQNNHVNENDSIAVFNNNERDKGTTNTCLTLIRTVFVNKHALFR